MNIRTAGVSIGLAAMALTAGIGVAAASSAPSAEASIPFANHGGIRDWAADRNRGVWVQDAHRNWYYAKLLGPCTGLNFAMSLGFDTRPMGTLDRFSSIVVPRERRCAIQSLVPSDAPPTKRKAPAAAAAPAPGEAS